MNSSKDVIIRQRRTSFASFIENKQDTNRKSVTRKMSKEEPKPPPKEVSQRNKKLKQTNEQESILFTQKASRKRSATKVLPNNFERTIIESELQLEKGFGGQELIAKILTLYSIGVEHYDSVGDQDNSQLYRDKIQLLFMKPKVIQEYTLIVRKASNHQDESAQFQQHQRRSTLQRKSNSPKLSRPENIFQFEIGGSKQSQNSDTNQKFNIKIETPQTEQRQIERIDLFRQEEKIQQEIEFQIDSQLQMQQISIAQPFNMSVQQQKLNVVQQNQENMQNREDQVYMHAKQERLLISNIVCSPRQKKVKRSKSKTDFSKKMDTELLDNSPRKEVKTITIQNLQDGYDTPARLDTIIRIDQLMDLYIEQKEKSLVVVEQEQEEQHQNMQQRLLLRNQSRLESKSNLNINKSKSTNIFNAENSEQKSSYKGQKQELKTSNQLRVPQLNQDFNNFNEQMNKLFPGLKQKSSSNLNVTEFSVSQFMAPTNIQINDIKFGDFMEDISYIKDQQTFQIQNQELVTSILIDGSQSSVTSNQSQAQHIMSPINAEEQKTPNPLSSDEVYSLEDSQKSNNQQNDSININLKDEISGGNSSSDIDMEQTEDFKQEEMKAIESFVDLKKSELSSINDKYETQVKQLELRGINPLTKKLIEKVKKEWSENIQKKESELEHEKQKMLLQVSQKFKSMQKQQFSSENASDSVSSFLENKQIQIVINDRYIASKEVSPIKSFDRNE
eukprot:403360826